VIQPHVDLQSARHPVFGAPGIVEPAWSPDGRWIAFARSSSEGAREGDVWLVRPDGGDPHQLRAHAIAPAWSPSGAEIAATLTDRGELSALGLGLLWRARANRAGRVGG
jgi:Tol biopolymer transport system component